MVWRWVRAVPWVSPFATPQKPARTINVASSFRRAAGRSRESRTARPKTGLTARIESCETPRRVLAAQIIARVRNTLDVGIPLRRLFDEPTIAGLAKAIEAERLLGVRTPRGSGSPGVWPPGPG